VLAAHVVNVINSGSMPQRLLYNVVSACLP